MTPQLLPTPDEGEAIREFVSRTGLHGFLEEFWPTIEPATPFVDNWHLGAICEHCEAVSNRDIRELVINVPPGCTKSITTGVAWPAWHWTKDPGHKWMFGGQDISVALRDAKRTVNVLESAEYRSAWPAVDLGGKVRALANFWNTDGGRRMAVSVGGKGIGEHCDTQVCDDPHKPEKALTALDRQKVSFWWSATMGLRQANPEKFARVIIMQRLHDSDLAGEMLKEQGYEHLCLPMYYVPKCQWDLGSSLNVDQSMDPRTKPGQLLWPERFSEDTVKANETKLKTRTNVEAQFQQNPTPDTGSYLQRSWLGHKWDDSHVKRPHMLTWVQSWDFGFDGKEGQSRVHGALWWILSRKVEGNLFGLYDETIGHWDYAESKRQFIAAQQRENWSRAKVKLIEKKANGHAIISELKDKFFLHEVNPKDSKEARLVRHQATFEVGQVLMPTKAHLGTVDEFIEELVKFPRGDYDDRVDTTTQFLDYCEDGAAMRMQALRDIQMPARMTGRRR